MKKIAPDYGLSNLNEAFTLNRSSAMMRPHLNTPKEQAG
jgi:hypothetical protein